MKILVCLKQVPAKDAPVKVASDGANAGKWIRDDVGYETNEPDAYALEEALRQKEAHGGEVVALTVGPARAAQVLREALAKGADRAVHVLGDDLAALDSYAAAEAISRAIAGQGFDLIFTGLQSADFGFGQTGVVLAELLGIPHSTIIMQVEPIAGGVRVKRELEGGFFQFQELPTPAVLTIQSGINQPRYATLMGIKQAKNKPLARLTLEGLGVAVNLNRQTIERVFAPARRSGGVLFSGSPEQQAAQLAGLLREKAAR